MDLGGYRYGERSFDPVREIIEGFNVHVDSLAEFFRSFEETSEPLNGPHGRKKYLNALQRISDGEAASLEVGVVDIENFFKSRTSSGEDGGVPMLKLNIVENVQNMTYRYLKLLYQAAEIVRLECTPARQPSATSISVMVSSKLSQEMEDANVPPHLRAPFEIHIVAPPSQKTLPVREVRSSHVGSLVKMEAIVTRVAAVKPRLQVATYRCYDCSANVFQSIDGPAYMPITECNSASCKNNRVRGELRLSIRESRFVRFQEVKVQEPPHHVPQGSIPRTLSLEIEGSLTRKLTPGMSITVGGILLPVAKTGFQQLRGGLVADTYFSVHTIDVHKRGYGETDDLGDEQLARVLAEYDNNPDLYTKLAYSLAPAICGHDDVKKALLLQLVGGVTETFEDGMTVRGDIHMLLIGDPGLAKSQFLRQVCKIAPRAHYTTGKGSSGVGLTASVIRDTLTGEFTLEGGAIVLADNGICCIDEFDKMDESDRTAIHEVMEQQTVSVAKAGLTTTLNARTSILAAANPVFGRYDVRRSVVENINLPAALLSRFDIQFLLLDRPDVTKDMELAKHVLYVHRHGKAPPLQNAEDAFDAKTMRIFIARAREYRPKLPKELVQEVVEHYVDLRSQERDEKESYTTPRTLLGILRMSQALARLRRSPRVDRGDFEEALRLMRASKTSILTTSEDDRRAARRSDFRSDIMEVIKDLDTRLAKRRGWKGWIPLTDIEERVYRLGFTQVQLKTTIDEYAELDVLSWRNDDKKFLGFCERLENVRDESAEENSDEDYTEA